MKNTLIFALLILLFPIFSFSATPDEATKKSVKKTTDVSFEDVLVQGKYHFSDEAVTTVEQDKVLDGLLGIRKDFKDRMKKSTARY